MMLERSGSLIEPVADNVRQPNDMSTDIWLGGSAGRGLETTLAQAANRPWHRRNAPGLARQPARAG